MDSVYSEGFNDAQPAAGGSGLFIYLGFYWFFFKRAQSVISVVCFWDCRSMSQASSTALICNVPGLHSHLGISSSVFQTAAQSLRKHAESCEGKSTTVRTISKIYIFEPSPSRKLFKFIPKHPRRLPCKSEDVPAKEISYFQIPSFMDLWNVPPVVRRKRPSCVFLFSNSGLDASVVRRQVALFPSRWLCDSLKMRKEDNELFFFPRMTKWLC